MQRIQETAHITIAASIMIANSLQRVNVNERLNEKNLVTYAKNHPTCIYK